MPPFKSRFFKRIMHVEDIGYRFWPGPDCPWETEEQLLKRWLGDGAESVPAGTPGETTCADPRCGIRYVPARANQTHCTPECAGRHRVRRQYRRTRGLPPEEPAAASPPPADSTHARLEQELRADIDTAKKSAPAQPNAFKALQHREYLRTLPPMWQPDRLREQLEQSLRIAEDPRRAIRDWRWDASDPEERPTVEELADLRAGGLHGAEGFAARLRAISEPAPDLPSPDELPPIDTTPPR